MIKLARQSQAVFLVLPLLLAVGCGSRQSNESSQLASANSDSSHRQSLASAQNALASVERIVRGAVNDNLVMQKIAEARLGLNAVNQASDNLDQQMEITNFCLKLTSINLRLTTLMTSDPNQADRIRAAKVQIYEVLNPLFETGICAAPAPSATSGNPWSMDPEPTRGNGSDSVWTLDPEPTKRPSATDPW